MTLCNNNDQTCFSDALTSAGPLGGPLNPYLSGSGFNITLGVQQMLMRRKTCLIPILLKEEPANVNKLPDGWKLELICHTLLVVGATKT